MSKKIDQMIDEIVTKKKEFEGEVKKETKGFTIWHKASAVLAVLIIISVLTQGFTFTGYSVYDVRGDFGVSSKPVTVDLFVMSECPYGVQFENFMFDVLNAFGNGIQYNVRFIVDSSGNGNYTSLHGPTEVEQDLRQLCILKNYGSSVYHNYLKCYDQQASNEDAQFKTCASSVGLDTGMIDACVKSGNVNFMLDNDLALTQKLGVAGSPSAFINGKAYSGSRTAASMQSEICKIDSSLSGCSAQLSSATQQASGNC